MKYRNASERLPAQLVRELQMHAPGELLYIPAVSRRPWGESTGAKTLYTRRNAEIREKYLRGQPVSFLSEAYCISDEAVRKIIYQRGKIAMSDKNGGYYWQNELVRIRRSKPEDWKLHDTSYDSFFTDCEQNCPRMKPTASKSGKITSAPMRTATSGSVWHLKRPAVNMWAEATSMATAIASHCSRSWGSNRRASSAKKSTTRAGTGTKFITDFWQRSSTQRNNHLAQRVLHLSLPNANRKNPQKGLDICGKIEYTY